MSNPTRNDGIAEGVLVAALSLGALTGGGLPSTANAQVANQQPVATAGIVNNNDPNFPGVGSNAAANINWHPNGFGDYVIKHNNRGGPIQYLGFDPKTKISYLGVGSNAGTTGNLYAYNGGPLTQVAELPSSMVKVKSLLSSNYYEHGGGETAAASNTPKNNETVRGDSSLLVQSPVLPSIAPGARTIVKAGSGWKLAVNDIKDPTKQRTFDLYRPHVEAMEMTETGMHTGVDYNAAKWAEPKYAQTGIGSFILAEGDGKVRLVTGTADDWVRPKKVVGVTVVPEMDQPAIEYSKLVNLLATYHVTLKETPGVSDPSAPR